MVLPLAAEATEIDDSGTNAAKRLRWAVGGGLGVIAIGLLAVIVAAQREPDFYRAALAEAPATAQSPAAAESLARRMVSKAAALHAAAGRAGPWEAVVDEREVNAWLAVDLPRNHRGLLPAGVESPRVRFQPRRVALAARMRAGPLATVAWAEIEVWLQGVNQVGLTVAAAGLGSLPVPHDAMLRHLATRLAAAGLVTDLRRTQRGLSLVVSPPSTYDAAAGICRLESLAVAAGELLVAGTTQRPAQGADD
jgi:subtilisin family serine protease